MIKFKRDRQPSPLREKTLLALGLLQSQLDQSLPKIVRGIPRTLNEDIFQGLA
jgi:hypothetical protein